MVEKKKEKHSSGEPRHTGRPPSSIPQKAGHAVIDLLKEAAGISRENLERAMTMAHRLSLELRSAKDRIRELEGDVERLESRATRAEQWLATIKKEIEDTLIAPMEANRSKPQTMN
jgi:chromosome segregation ATPase